MGSPDEEDPRGVGQIGVLVRVVDAGRGGDGVRVWAEEEEVDEHIDDLGRVSGCGGGSKSGISASN